MSETAHTPPPPGRAPSRRWILLNVLAVQTLAAFLLLVYLLRPIWNNMHNFFVDATGVDTAWFHIVVGGAWLLFVWFSLELARLARRPFGSPSMAFKVAFAPALVICAVPIAILIIETQNMYWKLTLARVGGHPAFWLLPASIGLCAVLLGRRWAGRPLGYAVSVWALLGANASLLAACLLLATLLPLVRGSRWGAATAPAPGYFELEPARMDFGGVPRTAPWKIVPLDREYGGDWFTAGDLDGDGAVEIVSAQNVDHYDTHHTTSVAAQELDGALLWRWGDPTAGGPKRSYDVACQVYDWNGDGSVDVLLSTDTHLIELDGATGAELRRLPLPPRASDCIVFCNVSGNERPTDVILKDRYHRMWVYDEAGRLLWTRTDPGGYMLAHQPMPMDVDGDGRDEILAGFALLNSDGSTRWVHESPTAKLWFGGHVDSGRLIRRGATPDATRIAMTYCDVGGITMLDGRGRQLWELTGRHYERISVGRVRSDLEGVQLVSDVHHQPRGRLSPLWLLGEDGTHLATIRSRDHHLLDWNGDSVDELISAGPAAVYDGRGAPLTVLDLPGAPGNMGRDLRFGDMNGDGSVDIVVRHEDRLFVFTNPSRALPAPSAPLGLGPNVTVY